MRTKALVQRNREEHHRLAAEFHQILETYRVGLEAIAPVRRLSEPELVELVYQDRKSTRLNSSHGYISYAVFCLKKKKTIKTTEIPLEMSFYIGTRALPRSVLLLSRLTSAISAATAYYIIA